FAPNDYTALLSAGLVAQIGLQAVLNIAVNTNSIPATGISLPFISYGGSSMLFLMASVGILLNISTYSRTPAEEAAAEESVAS
ncbi:MAG: FtsW/RodA/SpoVE family cell cycle protein, partial [Firmicutes bacterium]|nr:FtsW/RodA/SpoVE family cell cycle protein [Bacillota bacterium]